MCSMFTFPQMHRRPSRSLLDGLRRAHLKQLAVYEKPHRAKSESSRTNAGYTDPVGSIRDDSSSHVWRSKLDIRCIW